MGPKESVGSKEPSAFKEPHAAQEPFDPKEWLSLEKAMGSKEPWVPKIRVLKVTGS